MTPRVVANAVDEMLLVQRGRDLGYQLSDEQFEEILANLTEENGFETNEEFEEALLTSEGMTMSYLRRLMERQMLVGQVQQIEILGRKIEARRAADGVVWFDFPQICDGPRSQNDYIELSRCYQTVVISNVPKLTKELEDQTRRFVALVDEFYDRRVKLILSAATALSSLYTGERLKLEFQRTRSRLEEMQSHDYLASPHIP